MVFIAEPTIVYSLLKMRSSNGIRRKTRGLRIKPKDRGKIKIRKVLAKFDDDEKVAIKISPNHQNIPHPRFNGRVGKVVGKQGRAYYVAIMDGSKSKKILVTPEHLRRL